ncbi:MAG: ImmA/IrrE family metallo-endopeptidase [Chloroflexi bacterium]|nr:ImmA/IrrE family metallo-endopeptidase [Chloroflexota bacterium]
MRSRVSGWEHELWYYVSTGDGDNCPVFDKCQARAGGGWENAGHCSCQGVNCLSPVLTNNNFIEGLRPGRIYELIEKLAVKYLKMGGVKAPPVPSAIINLVDPGRSIEIRPVPLKAYHGAIWRIDDGWVVHLNSGDTREQQRLTLFHEAFHILAHCRATPVFKKAGNNRGSFNELLAENFACHALMPRRLVEEGWRQTGDVSRMAGMFGVPESAMTARLRSLELVRSCRAG